MKPFFKGKPLLVSAAVFVLLLFLHSLKIIDPLEQGASVLIYPVQKKLYAAGGKAGNYVRNLFTSKYDESEIMKAQIRSLLLQNARLKILAEENALLKKELGFNRQHNYELVPVRVIGYDTVDTSGLFIIEIENENYKNEDILPEMPVIVEDGILAGKIVSAKGNRIFMRPISSPQSAVAAAILNKTITIGVAEGEFNFGIKIRMIPQSENLKQGDLVITSGLEPKMPKGLLLGIVSKVEHDAQNPFDIAYLSPLYDSKNLSHAFIIKSF